MSGPGENHSSAPLLSSTASKGLLDRSLITQVSGRLPSLKPTRDLTLTQPAASVSKRTFVPNVKAKKDNTNGSSEADSTVPKSATVPKTNNNNKGQRKDTKKSDKGGGNFKRSADYVQSFSMFADGLGAGKSEKAASARAFARSAGSFGPKKEREDIEDVIKKEPEYIIQRKADKSRHDYFISDLKEGEIEPVRLPFRVKKEEKMEVDDVEEQEELSKSMDMPETAADAIFASAANQDYFLMQLPDKLPEVERVKVEEGDGDLVNWPEGEIGSLQVLDSGQIRLLVGGVPFSVGLGADICHLQDLMLFESSPDAEGDSNSGQLTRLGQLDKKLVCVPDLDDLLERLAARKDSPS